MNCGCVKALIDIGYLLSKNNIITKIMIILNNTKRLSLISNENIGKKVLLDFTKVNILFLLFSLVNLKNFEGHLPDKAKLESGILIIIIIIIG